MAAVAVTCSLIVSWSHREPATRAITQPGPIIVINEPGLAWSQVTAKSSPTLHKLASNGAVGSLATRNLSGHSCSSQSWMTLAAGASANYGIAVPLTQAGQTPGRCPGLFGPTLLAKSSPSSYSATYPQWNELRRLNLDRRPVPANVGNMTTRLNNAGQCVLGVGEFGGLPASRNGGYISYYTPSPANADLSLCPVTFIDFKQTDDALLTQLVDRAPSNATIVVAGLADEKGPEILHPVVISGPGVPKGLLSSTSTQQSGMLQTTDLSALVFSRLGADAPHLTSGRTPFVAPRSSAAAMQDAADLAFQLRVEWVLTASFMVRYLAVMVALLCLGIVAWLIRRRRTRASGIDPPPHSRLLRGWFAGVGALTAAMPVSTWLIGIFPWWRAPNAHFALGWGIAAISAVLAAAALLGPWRRSALGPPLFLATVTASVLLMDVLHGSRLQLTSIMGLQPVYGGRYGGMGNVGDALLATSALLVSACLAGVLRTKGHPRLAALTVILIGAVTIVIDGSPMWGADGAGPLAMFPAFAYLTLNAIGLRLTWRRAAVILGSAVVIVGTLAVLDYLRDPKDRTHLGDFVSQVRNHGRLSGLQRIVDANWNMLTGHWYTALVPLLLVLAVLTLLAPNRGPWRHLASYIDRVPMLGQGLAAIVVSWLIGFAANDSGVSIPPTGALLLVPLLILLAARLNSERYSGPRLAGTLAHRRVVPEDPPAAGGATAVD